VNRPDAASACGSRPSPPRTLVNTLSPPSRAPVSVTACAAAVNDPPARNRAASAGIVARTDSASARPAYTPPSSGSTRRATTSAPIRSRTRTPTAASSSSGGSGGSVGSASRAASPAALSTPASRTAATEAGTPSMVRAGSGRRSPCTRSHAAVVVGAMRSPASPAASSSSRPSGRTVSRASAPTSTGCPASSPTRSLPPSSGEPSSTVTVQPASAPNQAAARPAMPPPTTTRCVMPVATSAARRCE
jgi:hypothetical protein